MRVENLEQPPLNTSMMGVIKGALDHFGIACDAPRAFAGSGHAFVINVHNELCPSGPYCWNGEPFMALLPNIGLEAETLGMFVAPSCSTEEKARIEARIRETMDSGAVCSLLNLDNQLMLGHDETGFDMAQPWGSTMESTPARLTCGSWSEYADGPPVAFFAFRPTQPAPDDKLIADAIDYALDLWHHPARHTDPPYGMGPDAYTNWLYAIDHGSGGSHGNWWNATVWAECRAMAGRFFADIGEEAIGAAYAELAEHLTQAASSDLDDAARRDLVRRAAELEGRCVALLQGLAVAA